MLAQDAIHNKQLYMTIELYEMWCSEIYDRDLTSVGRIHDAMIQRGGGGGGGGGGGRGSGAPTP